MSSDLRYIQSRSNTCGNDVAAGDNDDGDVRTAPVRTLGRIQPTQRSDSGDSNRGYNNLIISANMQGFRELVETYLPTNIKPLMGKHRACVALVKNQRNATSL